VDIAVNCGGGIVWGQDGKQWQADRAYASGGWGYVGGKTYSANVPIAGTLDDALYQAERWGMSVYRFDLPPGIYSVQLKFAEVYGWKAGQRIFDVQIEGQTVLANLDIFAAAGRYTAYDRSFTVQAADGSLDIGFVARVDAPKINAIRIRSGTN
jgi:chitinase